MTLTRTILAVLLLLGSRCAFAGEWKPVDPLALSSTRHELVTRETQRLPAAPFAVEDYPKARGAQYNWFWNDDSGEYAFSPTRPVGKWREVPSGAAVYNDARLPEYPSGTYSEKRGRMIWFVDNVGRLLYTFAVPASTQAIDGAGGDPIEQFKKVVGP